MASQQNIFHRARNISENAYVSYEVAHLIAKHGKPFSDGEFVKECLMMVVGRVNPEKNELFEQRELVQANNYNQLTLKIK